MILKTTAIPLACYPYSSTSRIVHWLTRHHGKVATLLKGALRPRSPFLGEYNLFGTSELLYFAKRNGTLHTGKECALLHPRPVFRTDWRAMQSASCLTALFNKTTPEEAPCPELFELFEELLDWAEEYGDSFPFLGWAELRFCAHHGHAPQLENCTVCGTPERLAFSSTSGGTICANCSKEKKIATLGSPPDVLAILRNWQQSNHPAGAVKTKLSTKQKNQLSTLLDSFVRHHFHLAEYRSALDF